MKSYSLMSETATLMVNLVDMIWAIQIQKQTCLQTLMEMEIWIYGIQEGARYGLEMIQEHLRLTDQTTLQVILHVQVVVVQILPLHL